MRTEEKNNNKNSAFQEMFIIVYLTLY